ncbi:adenylosuccinate synthase [Paenibacillus sp. S150]|uniref:adenylosuccinate synthase n=1 Tax=Paenibacillus sp. S150 TaxID=2749826 RepID=UPI001C576005|nr:adenylosuccinate synthase [Paenibacillus sp. S150]MBW4085033.1 adenylosuccinate synthase [Paenibacillus sp. S150]
MAGTAIVGANWGDEGKGKITDAFAAKCSVVVRYQGGANAGHTIINEFGKFALHMLPSGVFHPHVTNIIGQGVALDISKLLSELDELAGRGVPDPALRISLRAQVVLPYHKWFDELEERRLGEHAFGSTKAGIAPFYSDKYLKLGIQVADLFNIELLRAKLAHSLVSKNVLLEHLYGQPSLCPDSIADELIQLGERIKSYVCDTTMFLQEANRRGEEILLEGQLGALRDPDNGIYPYSTSSSTLAGFAAVGAGIPPYAIKRIVAVTKAYSSCVGAGPFVDEIFGEEADELRRLGGDAGEYGATTGRPRRMGWFDAVATRYGCMLQGATEIALTNLDVLGYRDTIPVCVAYELNGIQTQEFPAAEELNQAKPVYMELQGWKEDISGVRCFEDLPELARQYVLTLEELIGVPIKWISYGPRREQLMEKM